MRRSRIVTGVFAGLIVLATATGCSMSPNAASKEASQQQAASNDIISAQPVPAFPYSVLRQNAAEIEGAQAKGGATTSFMFQLGSPDPIRTCASTGYPVPANASLSNPTQVIYPWNGSSGYTVDQMDPNGVYQSPSTSGTYVMCTTPSGKSSATYWEGNVETESGAATWDRTTHQVVMQGEPSFHFSKSCVMQGNTPVCN